jgi:multidrug efflux system membrane fusion protein
MKKSSILSLMIIGIALSGCSKPQKPTPKSVSVSVQKPTFKDVPLFIEVPGHMEALQAVNLGVQASGLITQILYQEGKLVQEGDLMVTIDDRPYIADVMKYEAQLLENNAQLQYAIDTYNRNTPLVAEDFISQESYENLGTNVAVLQATIDQTLAELEIAKINLDYCYIKAPITGIVGNKKIDVGNLVVKDDTQITLTTINQIAPIYASFYIPEKDFPSVIKASQNSENPLKVIVSYDEDFSDSYEGYLEFVDNQMQENTGMIYLKGILPNENSMLWPGVFVNVRLVLSIQKNAMLIPSDAVLRNSDGAFVFVADQGIARIKPVQLGTFQNETYVVKKGITEDDLIITYGQFEIYPGVPVSIKTQQGNS